MHRREHSSPIGRPLRRARRPLTAPMACIVLHHLAYRGDGGVLTTNVAACDGMARMGIVCLRDLARRRSADLLFQSTARSFLLFALICAEAGRRPSVYGTQTDCFLLSFLLAWLRSLPFGSDPAA
uniref:Uncharacterized protein n=1 Tax=Plectus sambesii TaxID=2011161 RepID=A0A914WQ08_9BILA